MQGAQTNKRQGDGARRWRRGGGAAAHGRTDARKIGVVVDARPCRSEFLEISEINIDQIPYGKLFDVVTFPSTHYDTPEVALEDGALKTLASSIAKKGDLQRVLQEIRNSAGQGDVVCLRWVGVNFPKINGNR